MNEINDLPPLSRSRTTSPILAPWFEPHGLAAQQHPVMGQTRPLSILYTMNYNPGSQLFIPYALSTEGLLGLSCKLKAYIEGGYGLIKQGRGKPKQRIQKSGSDPLKCIFLLGNFFTLGEFDDTACSPAYGDDEGNDAQR